MQIIGTGIPNNSNNLKIKQQIILDTPNGSINLSSYNITKGNSLMVQYVNREDDNNFSSPVCIPADNSQIYVGNGNGYFRLTLNTLTANNIYQDGRIIITEFENTFKILADATAPSGAVSFSSKIKNIENVFVSTISSGTARTLTQNQGNYFNPYYKNYMNNVDFSCAIRDDLSIHIEKYSANVRIIVFEILD